MDAQNVTKSVSGIYVQNSSEGANWAEKTQQNQCLNCHKKEISADLSLRAVRVNDATFKIIGSERTQHPRTQLLAGHRDYEIHAWIFDVGIPGFTRKQWVARCGDQAALADNIDEAKKVVPAMAKGATGDTVRD
ncbi:unnamed protein product, partial [marine sediment metagenome]